MNLRTFILPKSKIVTAIVTIGLLALVFACEEDAVTGASTSSNINFETDSLRIEENALAPLNVIMVLSEPLGEAGTVTIAVNEESSTATSTDYSTVPEIESGTITLDLPKGSPIAVFEFIPTDNEVAGDNKTAVFTITAASGGVVLGTDLTTSITIQDDEIDRNLSPSINTSVTNLDFDTLASGDTSASQNYTVSSSDLSSDILVEASDNFQVSLDNVTFSSSVTLDYKIANNGPMNVFVRFVADSGITQDINGSITHSSSGVSDQVTVIGSELVSSAIPSGTIVYNHNFDFGLGQDDPLSVSDFEGGESLYEDVTVGYAINLANPNSTGSFVNVRVQASNAKCEDDTTGGDCGNAFQIVRKGSSVTVTLSGLTPEAFYEVKYYVRPNGSSERSMEVFVTGDPSDPEEIYIDSNSSVYVEKTRTGQADSDGNLEIKFEYSRDDINRSISIDELSVTAI